MAFIPEFKSAYSIAISTRTRKYLKSFVKNLNKKKGGIQGKSRYKGLNQHNNRKFSYTGHLVSTCLTRKRSFLLNYHYQRAKHLILYRRDKNY